MKKRFLSIITASAMIAAMIPATAFASENVVLPEEMNGAWAGTEETDVVYFNDGNDKTKDYYDTMYNALNAVYKSKPQDVVKIYCKPGADLGEMTHAHVADNIDIYGNGAFVLGGEQDMEFDQWKYDRETGKQSADGEYMTKDLTVNVYDLDGIAAWGTRNTPYTLNLNFVNCKNMHRVYLNGTTGDNNITLTNCSFDAAKGSWSNTSVYSNAPGNITITGTDFSGVAIPVNLNNKSNGVQNVTITDCEFNDCSTPELANKTSSKSYAAPVRIVTQTDATTNLVVDNLQFNYTSEPSLNGDVLLGDGRADGNPNPGKITLSMTNTDAEVQQQTPGYFDKEGNIVNPDNTIKTPVRGDQVANLGEDGDIVVEDNVTEQPTDPSKPAPEGEGQGSAGNSPDTSDDILPLAVSVLALLLSTVAATAIIRRKKNN